MYIFLKPRKPLGISLQGHLFQSQGPANPKAHRAGAQATRVPQPADAQFPAGARASGHADRGASHYHAGDAQRAPDLPGDRAEAPPARGAAAAGTRGGDQAEATAVLAGQAHSG